MNRADATSILRDELDLNGLMDWHVRLTNDSLNAVSAYCVHSTKTLVLNVHKSDIITNEVFNNIIRHQIGHAILNNNEHNEVWSNKVIELGCTDTLPCAAFVINNIEPIKKSIVTVLKDKCPYCNKIAVEVSSSMVNMNYPIVHKKFIKLECGHTLIKDIPQGTPFHLFVSNSDLPEVANCKHEWGTPSNKNQCKHCGQYKALQFQIDGMKFGEASLNVNKGCGIFDEQGLGKTIQALGLVKYALKGSTLYIVKSGLKFQWSKQILIWLGPEYVPQIIESSNDYIIPNLRSYIIGYDMLVPKIKKLKSGKQSKQGFDISKLEFINNIILDECQQIKNPDSSRTQQVRKLARDKKIIPLSGTPWKNKGSEFFSALNMIAPLKFSSFAGFKRAWVETVYEGNKAKEGGIRNIPAFKDYCADIVIRRERTEVMSELPLINRMKLYCSLDTIEQKTYNDEVSAFVKWYNEYVISGTEDQINGLDILAKLARMRHIVALAKIPQTIDFVDSFIDETDRSLIIGLHHRDVGSILLDELTTKFGSIIQVLTINAQMNGKQRFDAVEKFNTKRSIMLGSQLAMGEGVDGLQRTCGDCLNHERQWNPANEEQFEGRLLRMGAKFPFVNSTYVEAEGTVDEILDSIVERKRLAFHEVMNKGNLISWNDGDLIKEVAGSIVKKFNELNKSKSKQLVKVE